MRVFGIQVFQSSPRQDDRGGDVVLNLDLVRRMEVGTKLVDTPRAIRVESHAKIVAHQHLVVVLQLVTEKAVDAIDREMLAPIDRPIPGGSNA